VLENRPRYDDITIFWTIKLCWKELLQWCNKKQIYKVIDQKRRSAWTHPLLLINFFLKTIQFLSSKPTPVSVWLWNNSRGWRCRILLTNQTTSIYSLTEVSLPYCKQASKHHTSVYIVVITHTRDVSSISPHCKHIMESLVLVYSLAQVPAGQSQLAPHLPFSFAQVPAGQSQLAPHLPFSLAQVPAAQSQLAPHFPLSLAIVTGLSVTDWSWV